MIKLYSLSLSLIMIFISSCSAEKIKYEPIAPNTNSTFQPLQKNWINFSSADWRGNLGLSSQCRNLDQEDEQRLKNTIPIDQDSFLLLLTCELGAYQDAQFVYLVNSDQQTVKELVFEVPEYTDEWRFTPNKLVWGAVYKDPDGEVLEVINLSAATGMCGYVAYYKISDVLNSNPINLYKATGDDDCYNGVTVEYWPIIKSES
ncbi:hypothetical protein MAH1_04970 [Sessilibacter sp. MAH1]